MRKIASYSVGFDTRIVARITNITDLVNNWEDNINLLVKVSDLNEKAVFLNLNQGGLDNIYPVFSNKSLAVNYQNSYVVTDSDAIMIDDVVAILDEMSYLHVLQRESDLHHTVFLTNQCNSNCLMCSQPPTRHDDSWLIDEALEISKHIKISPACIGFSGGEPLLLGNNLSEVIDSFISRHPRTKLEILSNGRALADAYFSEVILSRIVKPISWMIPLYGPTNSTHDYIVQRHGAFNETLLGLFELHKYGHTIQIRIVLIEPVLEVLTTLCEFIAKNLPFVKEIAIMGCEPIGFALANYDICNIDLRLWIDALQKSIDILEKNRIPIVIMNVPLCALPKDLRHYAHKSISDWKQKYLPECNDCVEKPRCSGVFSWYKPSRDATEINKIQVISDV